MARKRTINLGEFGFRPIVQVCPFPEGNKLAAKENMSEDAHERRMKGLYSGWGNVNLKGSGVRIMGHRTRKKIARTQRKKRTVAVLREAREIQNIGRMNAETAMRVAKEIMNDPQERAADRLAAVNLILDRAYGKATQTNLNASLDANGKADEISSKELDTRIAETLTRVEKITGRTEKPSARRKRLVEVRDSDRNPGGASVH